MHPRLSPILALCAALAALAVAAPAVAAPQAPRIRIVILPIVVHSAAPDTSFVSRGISDMISSRLEQTGRVSVDRIDDPASGTTQLGEALRLGQQRGGDYLVYGAFTQFGDGASLDVHCIPLRVGSEAEAAAARRIFIQSGAVGEIIPKLDEIVDRVAVYVRAVPGNPDGGRVRADAAETRRAATADAAALRALVERIEALERAVFSGDANTASQAPVPAPES